MHHDVSQPHNGHIVAARDTLYRAAMNVIPGALVSHRCGSGELRQALLPRIACSTAKPDASRLPQTFVFFRL
jgi:hypothetical protein